CHGYNNQSVEVFFFHFVIIYIHTATVLKRFNWILSSTANKVLSSGPNDHLFNNSFSNLFVEFLGYVESLHMNFLPPSRVIYMNNQVSVLKMNIFGLLSDAFPHRLFPDRQNHAALKPLAIRIIIYKVFECLL